MIEGRGKACYNMHIVAVVFKCIYNNAPDLFKEYFVKTLHNYSTRHNGLNIIVPKVSSETVRRHLLFQGSSF